MNAYSISILHIYARWCSINKSHICWCNFVSISNSLLEFVAKWKDGSTNFSTFGNNINNTFNKRNTVEKSQEGLEKSAKI